MRFNPIYGWGWFKESNGSVPVPSPFNVSVESSTDQAVDGVVGAPHEYAGWRIHCESRDSEGHNTLEGHYTVVLDSPDGSERVTGFAIGDA